jgi:hypothetical protein
MAPSLLAIELLTVEPCGEACGTCRDFRTAMDWVAKAGIGSEAQGRHGLRYFLQHRSVDESGVRATQGRDPPVLRINGRVLLAGAYWTANDVLPAVQAVLPPLVG